MFEQTMLAGGPLSTRLWTTCAGITGQAILVGATLLVPLIWPAALPQIQSYIGIVPAGSATAAPAPGPTVRPKGTVRIDQVIRPIWIPSHFPARPAIIVDDPPDLPSGGGVPGGVQGGVPGGVPNAIVSSVLEHAYVPPPPPTPVAAPPKPAVTQAAAPIRVPVGGQVRSALRSTVSNPSPRTAISMRVEGVVEIEAVVGVDGRIREMKAKSGHPFLIPAALEAVRQWVYTQPSSTAAQSK